jgi:V8-like Glu-specific endopeptidase
MTAQDLNLGITRLIEVPRLEDNANKITDQTPQKDTMKYGLTSLHLLSCSLAATLCLSTPAHALINGTDTTSFSALGEIGGASGVLIADNWVLTAVHVANGLTAGTSTFTSVAGSSLVDQVYTFSSAAFPNNDIALVHLSTSIDAALPVLNDQIIKSNQSSSLGTMTVATAQNQSPNGYGTVSPYKVVTTNTDSTTGVTSTVNWIITSGTVHVAGGDSGGALFKGAVTDSGGAVLLGITSAAPTLTTGEALSAFVQVAYYKSWIDATMASSGQVATWSSTVSSVPEPSTLALYMLGGMAALLAWTRHSGQNS